MFSNSISFRLTWCSALGIARWKERRRASPHLPRTACFGVLVSRRRRVVSFHIFEEKTSCCCSFRGLVTVRTHPFFFSFCRVIDESISKLSDSFCWNHMEFSCFVSLWIFRAKSYVWRKCTGEKSFKRNGMLQIQMTYLILQSLFLNQNG